MSRGWKVGLAIAAGVVALNLLLQGVRVLTGGTPGGPASSSYATSPRGAAAYAALLARAGHDVRRERRPAREVELDPRDTAVVLDPSLVLPADRRRLAAFVRAGGRLVASVRVGNWLQKPFPQLARERRGDKTARVLAPVAETAGVREVATRGEGTWESTAGALPAVGDENGTLLAVARLGEGTVALLADASPLQNSYLARADNARLAVALAGAPARDVVFFESYHGYGRATGFASLPSRVLSALLLGILAVAALMLARGRRFGPPEAESRALAPPRAAYVEAMGSLLTKARDRKRALEPLRAELRRRVRTRAGLRSDAPDDAIAAAAGRLGLARDDVERALGDDELALARALAQTADDRRRAWTS